MPIMSTSSILEHALAHGYGVAAFNVVNELTMEAVVAAAQELQAPVVVQTSVKTVTFTGIDVIYATWRELAKRVTVPVSLHLDHCPDRSLISQCLAAGWNSVLFDASKLSVEENKRQCADVVAEAKRYGADVEGEIEGFKRTHEITGEESRNVHPLETVVDFVSSTGVSVFAPAIGNAHGVYTSTPKLDGQRVTDIVQATGIPVALHGGTGMTPAQFSDLIARGCAKINISTALKIALLRSTEEHLAAHPLEYDPPSVFEAQRAAVLRMAKEHIRLFGSDGKAWK